MVSFWFPGGAWERGLSTRTAQESRPTLKRFPLAAADFQHGLVGPFFQRRIARVARFLVGIVAGRVVAADQGPAGIGAAVLRRRVEQVAVEEDGRAGLQ